MPWYSGFPPRAPVEDEMGHIPKLENFSNPNYNPDVPDELAYGDALDPWPMLHDLAKRAPVMEGDFRELMGMAPDTTMIGKRVFLVLGYDEIREVLSNQDNFGMQHHLDGLAQTFGSHSLTVLDPPHHPRYRRIFQKAFLPHVVGTWSGEYIEPVINDLIGGLEPAGRCDLMEAFVRPYPFEIIYRQLRLPPGETDIFYRLSMALTLYIVDFASAREAHDKLGEYFQALVDDRRANPGGTDLISVLANVEVEGERLPDAVLRSFFRQLMNAAGDTTYRSTGSLLVGLLSERPDQFEMVKKDRSLVAKAIEETLRWEGPINYTIRGARRDTVLSGVKIPKDAIIQVVTGITNRDPAIFENPDIFDLTRPMPRSHLAFAAGPHVCLGQHLARLEMGRALNILMDRLPKLRLNPDYPKPQIRGNQSRRPRNLHVRFD
jgi:cytochrome P450